MHAAFSRSDVMLLVTDSSVRGAFGVSRLMNGLTDLEVADSNYILVLNKSQYEPEHEARKDRIKKILPSALSTEIRLDHKLSQRAADRGKFIKDEQGGSDLAKDYEDLARKIARFVGMGGTERGESFRSRGTGLIDKLKSIGGRK